MKKGFLLSTVVAIFSLTASAQIKKGSIFLGGDVSTGRQGKDFNTSQPVYVSRYANFSISAGWFVKQNSLVGIYTSYGHYHYNNSYGPPVNYRETKGDRYSAGLFYRQYKKLAKDFYLFGELGAGYFGSNETDVDKPSNITTEYKGNGAVLYLTPGISYRLYKKLYVELSSPYLVNLQYADNKEKSPGYSSSGQQFNFSTNITSSLLNSLGIGFRFIL